MILEQYIPYLIQIVTTVIAFAFLLGKYKAAFDHHEKILTQHEKILDRHEQAINGIINRLYSMNNEIHYIKGFTVASKQN